MKQKEFLELKIGESLRLTEDVPGRYSGYGGNPARMIKAGTIVTVKSEEALPSVYRENVYFRNCVVSDWPEGVAVLPSQVEKVEGA